MKVKQYYLYAANSNYTWLFETGYSKVDLTTTTTREEDHKKRQIKTTHCFVQDGFIKRPEFERLQLAIWIWKGKKKKYN